MMFSFGRHEEKNYILRRHGVCRASEWRLPVKAPIRHPSACVAMTHFSTYNIIQKKKALIEMWIGCMSSKKNEPVLVKIFEVVERWVTVNVWVRA